MTLPRALATYAATVLGPWAIVLTIVATVLTAPPSVPTADAAPRVTRMAQVRTGDVSIGVAVDSRDRLRCISVVTGRTPAVVSVSLGGTRHLRDYRVAARRETGCIAAATRGGRSWLVPRRVYVFTRTSTRGAVTRTLLP